MYRITFPLFISLLFPIFFPVFFLLILLLNLSLYLSLLPSLPFSLSRSLLQHLTCVWIAGYTSVRQLNFPTTGNNGCPGHYRDLPFFLLPWPDLIIIRSFDIFVSSNRLQNLSSIELHERYTVSLPWPFCGVIQLNFLAMVFFPASNSFLGGHLCNPQILTPLIFAF